MRKAIGLDLDGVLVGLPPLTSSTIIEYLYKDQKATKLSYRFPGSVEQSVRKLTHFPFVRPPLEPNCTILRKIYSKYDLYLITGRYKFLENLTNTWLSKYNLTSCFKKIYINTKNEQPHLFKNQIITKLKLSAYIEDDFDSIMYLATHNVKTQFYWYTKSNTTTLNASNVVAIDNIDKVLS